MADRSTKPADVPAPAAEPVPGRRLAPQMRMMLLTFWASPQRNKILLLGIALVAVIGATAFGQVRLNAWNQPFYDALSHKDLHGFIESKLGSLSVSGRIVNLKSTVPMGFSGDINLQDLSVHSPPGAAEACDR